MPIRIRKMLRDDWPAVAEIYREGIETGFATFETDIPSYDSWNNAHLSTCRLSGVENDQVLGWAALSPVSSRCVYGGVAEVSVYVSKSARGKGIGLMLMHELIKQSEDEGFWTLQSGIFPENIGSIKLHEKVGFRRIGVRERIGKLGNTWRDNLIFERRSTTIGTDK